MKKNYYSICVSYNGKTHSYFGLTEEDRDLVSAMLKNLGISYDTYLLIEEKRFKRIK